MVVDSTGSAPPPEAPATATGSTTTDAVGAAPPQAAPASASPVVVDAVGAPAAPAPAAPAPAAPAPAAPALAATTPAATTPAPATTAPAETPPATADTTPAPAADTTAPASTGDPAADVAPAAADDTAAPAADPADTTIAPDDAAAPDATAPATAAVPDTSEADAAAAAAAAAAASTPPAVTPPADTPPPAVTPSATAEAWAVATPTAGAHTITVVASGADLVVTLDGVASTRPLAEVTGLTLTGGDGDDTFSLGAIPEGIPVAVDGGAGIDTILGPAPDTTWTITGAGSGTIGADSFAGIEWLRGAAGNNDTFVLEHGATLAGGVDGGDGGFDTLVVKGDYDTFASNPTDAHSGTLTLDGNVLAYFGLEPITNTGTAANVVFDLPAGGNDATLSTSGGLLRLSGATFELTDFAAPSGSVTINGGSGSDGVTISGTIDLAGASLAINAENITVAPGAQIVNAGDVTFNAVNVNPSPTDGATLSASVLVHGAITASGAVALTSQVDQSASLSGQSLTDNLTFSLDSTSRAELLAGAVVTSASLLLQALTNVTFSYVADAPASTTAYDYVSFPGGGSVTADITSLTHAGISGGGKAIVGSAAISGLDPSSVAIEAVDTTNVDVSIVDTFDDITPFNLAALAASLANYVLVFDRLTAATNVSRDTKAFVEDTPAAGDTLASDGAARLKAENRGTVSVGVVSDFVGEGTNDVALDSAVASIAGALVDAGALDLVAHTDTTYAATAKAAENDVTGETSALVSDSTITSGAGVRLDARDDSTNVTLSADQIQVSGTPFVTITNGRARNDVTRTTEASIEASGVSATGSVDVLATENAVIGSTMRSVSIREKSSRFPGVLLPAKSAKALAATLAINVILGGVDAHISGSTVDADAINVLAHTDQARIDATAEAAANARTSEDAVSFPAPPTMSTAPSRSARRSRSTTSAGTSRTSSSTSAPSRRRSTRSSPPTSARSSGRGSSRRRSTARD